MKLKKIVFDSTHIKQNENRTVISLNLSLFINQELHCPWFRYALVWSLLPFATH